MANFNHTVNLGLTDNNYPHLLHFSGRTSSLSRSTTFFKKPALPLSLLKASEEDTATPTNSPLPPSPPQTTALGSYYVCASLCWFFINFCSYLFIFRALSFGINQLFDLNVYLLHSRHFAHILLLYASV